MQQKDRAVALQQNPVSLGPFEHAQHHLSGGCHDLQAGEHWVDRGAPAVPEIARTLRFFYDRHDPDDAPRLQDAAQMLFGMVAADASEVQIAGYLKHLAREFAIPFPPHARLASVAVWHTAKAALVRDAAARRTTSEGPRSSPGAATAPLRVARRAVALAG